MPSEILLKAGIDFAKVIQNQGEIVFTPYGAYHWTFNGGFNVCELSNLASPIYKEIHLKILKSSRFDVGIAIRWPLTFSNSFHNAGIWTTLNDKFESTMKSTKSDSTLKRNE